MGEEALRETEEKDDVWSETIPQPLSFAQGKKRREKRLIQAALKKTTEEEEDRGEGATPSCC